MKMTGCIHIRVCRRHYDHMPGKRGRYAVSEQCSLDCPEYESKDKLTSAVINSLKAEPDNRINPAPPSHINLPPGKSAKINRKDD